MGTGRPREEIAASLAVVGLNSEGQLLDLPLDFFLQLRRQGLLPAVSLAQVAPNIPNWPG